MTGVIIALLLGIGSCAGWAAIVCIFQALATRAWSADQRARPSNSQET